MRFIFSKEEHYTAMQGNRPPKVPFRRPEAVYGMRPLVRQSKDAAT
jgi:hypothetical protein